MNINKIISLAKVGYLKQFVKRQLRFNTLNHSVTQKSKKVEVICAVYSHSKNNDGSNNFLGNIELYVNMYRKRNIDELQFYVRQRFWEIKDIPTMYIDVVNKILFAVEKWNEKCLK